MVVVLLIANAADLVAEEAGLFVIEDAHSLVA
jgi:hypothetical protein